MRGFFAALLHEYPIDSSTSSSRCLLEPSLTYEPKPNTQNSIAPWSQAARKSQPGLEGVVTQRVEGERADQGERVVAAVVQFLGFYPLSESGEALS